MTNTSSEMHTHQLIINPHPHMLRGIQSSIIGMLCDGVTAACQQRLAADVCVCGFVTIVAPAEHTEWEHLD